MINDKKDILSRINSITSEIKEADNNNSSNTITQIRLNILSLLEDIVTLFQQQEFSLWIKDNLLIAIADIRWNIERGKRSTFMLTACLFSIEKAIKYKKEISKNYPRNNKRVSEIEKLEPNDFFYVINKLKSFSSIYED